MHRRLTLLAAVVLSLPLLLPAGAMAGAARPVIPAGGVMPVAAPSEVQLTVVSYRMWMADGAVRIVGEVRNTSSYRVNGWVTVQISPGHTGPSETLMGWLEIGNLAPGRRSPFSIVRSPFYPASTTVVAISAGGYVQPDPSAAIGVSSTGGFSSDPALTGGTGDVIRVQVRNTTDRPVHVFQVVASFRGSDGRVSNVGTGMRDVEIAPGDLAEDWAASAFPSGKLAARAEVDVVARYADFPYEPVVSWQNWFRDIDGQSLASSIAWLAENGITGGCAPYRYCPDAGVTRAQMAMFLVRAFHLPAAVGPDHFTDDNGRTGESSINALFEAGITGGCAPGRFCPAANVTRAQMAMFLDRAIDPPLAGTSTDFFDDDDGRTGEAAINRLAEAGITGGCGPRRFCPAASVTRAQMAAFLQRVLTR